MKRYGIFVVLCGLALFGRPAMQPTIIPAAHFPAVVPVEVEPAADPVPETPAPKVNEKPAEPTAEPPPAPAQPITDYDAMATKAKREGKPIIVWIPTDDYELGSFGAADADETLRDFVQCIQTSFPDVTGPAVVVGIPQSGGWMRRYDLPASATSQRIRALWPRTAPVGNPKMPYSPKVSGGGQPAVQC